ncbi:hypothetical protein HDU76_013725 [Blyttiomyces sp. JEL0837]|nr:hypothetical protein HDU76_013725 [Blyttiomyces sp. JEL0837]
MLAADHDATMPKPSKRQSTPSPTKNLPTKTYPLASSLTSRHKAHHKTHLTKKADRGIDGQQKSVDAAAPWKLTIARSFVFVFNVDRETHKRVLKPCQVVESDRLDSVGQGLGALMIIQYSDSPVGPYDELILMDGPYQPRGRPSPANNPLIPDRRLPHIWVSSESSLRNGRKNWGIRKELADFQWSKISDSQTRITIRERYTRFNSAAGTVLLDIVVSTPLTSLISIPASTWGPIQNIIPYIVEKRIDEEGEVLEGWVQTALKWNGWVRPSTIVEIKSCGGSFPDLKQVKGVEGSIWGGMITGDMHFLEAVLLKEEEVEEQGELSDNDYARADYEAGDN